MLDDALAFPRNGDDWLATIAIGAVLSLLSFLIVPGLIVQGYMLRVARASAEGRHVPPTFDNWVGLLVDGVKAFVVAVVYGVVPIVLVGGVMTVLVGGTVVSVLSGFEGAAVGFGLLLAVVGGVLIPVLLVTAYLAAVAQVRLAVTGSLSAAFEVTAVARIGFDLGFFAAVVLAIVVGFVLSVVGGLLVIVLVGFLVLFYAQMVTYYLFGQGYAKATGEPANRR